MKKLLAFLGALGSRQSATVGGAALLIAFAGITSRILGFLRDRVLASEFGAGDVLDAYYTAFRLPDLVYGFLVLGALAVAFVPIFTELLTKEKRREAWALTSGVLSIALFFVGLLSLVGILFSGTITELLAPGYGPAKKELVTQLTRIMLLSPLLLSASAVFGGVLVSFKQFAAYSFAPVFYNLGIIFGAIILTPLFGPIGLAWGVVLGSFFHMIVQYPALRRSGFVWQWGLRSAWLDVNVRRVIKLMIPRSLGMAVNQISLFVMTIFASTLISGSLAAFTLANNIQSVPLGLFGIAFALAVFPALSLFAAQKEEKDFFLLFAETGRKILFFVVPLSIFIIIFRAQCVRVILGSGHFDWQDTIATFEILKFLAISLFAQSLIPLFARAFFALQDTKTPLYIALVSEALHIALIPWLLPHYAVQGLAIAFSISTVLNFVLLYFFLRRKLSFWEDRLIVIPVGKILLASLLAGVVAQVSKSVFVLTTNELDTFVEVFLQLALGFTIGVGAFVLFSHWLKIEELTRVKRFVLCRLFGQPETAALTEDHPERGDW
ncbi:MAG: murein biosynthesis integral membrane protein MurJ [Candidatus Moranbacteria bacterium]|jgi:putative peptidoglycan lipid II flippase|nr:murein biosynthesis integral membrane protein MurJ [Candidatus Moranbacteria bacterium]